MNENKLFDDIARTLASPIPRRQAFRQILRGLAGAALTSVFGSGTARAVGIKCPPGEMPCGIKCCQRGEICYNEAIGLCCTPGKACGIKCCQSGEICYNAAIGLCCPPGSRPCGTLCNCPSGQICVDGKCKAPISKSSNTSTGT